MEGYQTVEQVTGNIMLEMGLPPDQRIFIRNKLIDFVIYFRTFIRAEIKVKQIFPIPQTLVIPFPKDYLGFDKVGWVVNGAVHLVAQNPNIAKILSLNQPGIFLGGPTVAYNYPNGQPAPPNGTQFPYSSNNTWWGRGSGTVSGAPIRELDGYFMEDWTNKCLRLSTYNVFPNLYWSYVSSCIEPSSECCIHPWSYLFAKAFAKYYYLMDAYNTPENKLQRAAQEFDLAKLECERAMKGLSVFDYLSVWDRVFGFSMD